MGGLRRDLAGSYGKLFDCSPDPCLLFVDGVVVHANSAAHDLFRAASRADLIGRRSTELLHPQCVAAVEQRVTAFLERRVTSVRTDERYLRLDGDAVDVETTVVRASFIEGKAFIIALRDVAARSLDKERLQEDVRGEPLPRRLEDLIADLASRHRLALAQKRIVYLAAESSAHEVICAKLGISKNTLKTQIGRILERTGAGSLEELVAPLRAAALRR